MNRPGRYFTLIAVILFATAILTRNWTPGQILDLQIHDTYFVVAPSLFLFVMCLFAALFAVTYELIPTNPRAVRGHLWLTVTGLGLFWISFYVVELLVERTMNRHSATPAEQLGALLAFVVSNGVVLLSPVFFIVNLAIAISKRLRTAH
jgi:heme/copper-type cytochrome/quinol oxidase subunit 1